MEHNQASSRRLAPPSKVISSKFDDVEGAKETEIAAQITLPRDGGWGWVVLLASFSSVTILDGLVFSYGALLTDIAEDFKVNTALVALVGSINYTCYLMLSPIASSLINRFGFRFCGMCGGMICCFSVLSSTFAKDFTTFILLYGVCHGIGSSFTSMAAYLVVGLYFQKYRTVALITVTTGSSLGIMTLSPTNMNLVKLAGWRPTVLLHSGLLGLIFFFAQSYRPLVSLNVENADDAALFTRTVTFLPDEKVRAGVKPTANAAERILGAVSNTRYPTAATVVQDPITSLRISPDTSAEFAKPRITLSTSHGISQSQLKQVRTIISKGVVEDQPVISIRIQNEHEPTKKKSCWARLCHWPSHVKSARPLYRDDAFYDGKMKNLPQYRKSLLETGEKLTGLEYQMEVSRAATVQDLNDRRGVCTTAVKRVLATMFSLELLKQNSFKVLCLAGVCNYLGVLTPLIYLQHRNLDAGISPSHCTYFLSVVGCFNAVGRLVWCLVAAKIGPSYVYSGGLMAAGLLTILSGVSYSVPYQYSYCVFFGLTVSVTNSMRSLMIVDLYGLQHLTNGTGMLLLFMGIGNLLSTPLAGLLRDKYGFDSAFYFAGSCLMMAGIISSPIKSLRKKENEKAALKEEEQKRKRAFVKPKVYEKEPLKPAPTQRKVYEPLSEESVPKAIKLEQPDQNQAVLRCKDGERTMLVSMELKHELLLLQVSLITLIMLLQGIRNQVEEQECDSN